MGMPVRAPQIWRFGVFEVDSSRGELRRNGLAIKLQEQPFHLLLLLLEHPGELVTRERLQRELWTAETFVDFDTGLNTAVRKLRQALGDAADHPLYIETRARYGYRFVAPVSVEPSALPSEEAAPAAPELESAVPTLPVKEAASVMVPVPEKRMWRLGRPRLFGAGAVAVLLLLAFLLERAGHRSEIRQLPIRSLVVLPLKNLSGDPSQEYFADGMTEAITSRLSTISELRVISRTSAMHFKDTHMSAPEITSALHVDSLVEGSVIRDHNRVHVNA